MKWCSLSNCNWCALLDIVPIIALSKLVNAQNTKPDLIINIELAKINEWLENNKLSLNCRKTKFMVFHTRSKNGKAFVPRI